MSVKPIDYGHHDVLVDQDAAALAAGAPVWVPPPLQRLAVMVYDSGIESDAVTGNIVVSVISELSLEEDIVVAGTGAEPDPVAAWTMSIARYDAIAGRTEGQRHVKHSVCSCTVKIDDGVAPTILAKGAHLSPLISVGSKDDLVYVLCD